MLLLLLCEHDVRDLFFFFFFFLLSLFFRSIVDRVFDLLYSFHLLLYFLQFISIQCVLASSSSLKLLPLRVFHPYSFHSLDFCNQIDSEYEIWSVLFFLPQHRQCQLNTYVHNAHAIMCTISINCMYLCLFQLNFIMTGIKQQQHK